ncbi:L-seryl-tRNA(Sec) selenium transferase [Sulfuriroseicoccus oceanibius]|uniref:L-seryl-tRNA(Sec) selenium transferase n=1 Tax=Sulfuriroseicoccus oceanibius TaxID=2707525 RepID=A0A6B3L7Z8_9BACT|nr:L-seryl-tRNA(Sec) selenium transferase [Sulfuriroseicoccus oceanibius]QQL43865.1 L-seryl-tRNA(Sec) selenium transferase [Sulfuriroseicoccus oceanibius]
MTDSSSTTSSPQSRNVNLRELPSIDKVVVSLRKRSSLPHPILVKAVRGVIENARAAALESGTCQPREQILAEVEREVARIDNMRLKPVINATGVMIHTNLGRSPLGARTTSALAALTGQYTNLEFDLATGKRGKRGEFAELALATLCQSEAATTTNNCAAAVMLALRHLTTPKRNEVIISRSELVEIGGGFRVPEILECSGATLREVGTTNKTHLDDYRNAINERTALILMVHRSNFYIGGFTADVDHAELSALAREHNLPLLHDLGSGSVMATDQLAPIEHEPTPIESLDNGSDLVCFSGDKLLGGPQAGIIAGNARMIAGIKKDPFFRAVRCDKSILATLQETASAYLEASTTDGSGIVPDIPVVTMLSTPIESLIKRADAIIAQISAPLEAAGIRVRRVESTSRTGGGTMPRSSAPSVAIQLDATSTGHSADALITALRTHPQHPTVGYIENNLVEINLRTVFPFQDESLTEVLQSLVKLPV